MLSFPHFFTLVCVILAAQQDARSMRISDFYAIAMIIVGAFLNGFAALFYATVIISLFVIQFYHIQPSPIKLGDGYLLAGIASMLGPLYALCVFALSMAMVWLVARSSKKKLIAFAPYLFLALAVTIAVNPKM